jgi:hypothetical protein
MADLRNTVYTRNSVREPGMSGRDVENEGGVKE